MRPQMKIVCLNKDNCGYVEHLTKDQILIYTEKFYRCTECSYLAVRVPSNFNFDLTLKEIVNIEKNVNYNK